MNFSLNWFKSKKEIEPTKLSIVLPITVAPIEYIVTNTAKPYKSVKMVNDVLTVVLPDGEIIIKPSATNIDFEKVVAANSLQEIEKIVAIPEVLEQKLKDQAEQYDIIVIREGIETLKDLDNFVIKDDALYMKGSERSIPKLVADAFIKVVGKAALFIGDIETNLLLDVNYTSLKKFWLKCCLNPSAQSAEDLYTFLSNHQFKIDRHGNFYAYRRVVKVYSPESNSDLVDFISNTYNKIKAVWKKKPIDFMVVKDDDDNFSIEKRKLQLLGENKKIAIGNLEELYKNLPNMTENRYTDDYTHSFDYRVGKSVSMPRHMGDDDNTVSCSKGFHASSKKYDYSGFGNTPILMIINPIDVLAVPLGEIGKLRVCRWFFAMTLPEDEKYILEDEEFDVTDLGDVFEEECMTDLAGYVQTSFAQEVQRHTFSIPQISARELSNVVESLANMKDAISKRVTIQ